MHNPFPAVAPALLLGTAERERLRLPGKGAKRLKKGLEVAAFELVSTTIVGPGFVLAVWNSGQVLMCPFRAASIDTFEGSSRECCGVISALLVPLRCLHLLK